MWMGDLQAGAEGSLQGPLMVQVTGAEGWTHGKAWGEGEARMVNVRFSVTGVSGVE